MQDRQRSRGYPGYGLSDCVEWVYAVRKELGSGSYDRKSIAQAIGSSGLSGAAIRKIAAMTHFGLLKKDADGYALSSVSDRITRAISEGEKRGAIVEAFFSPALFKELMERINTDGQVPSMLENILARYYDIEDSATERAGKIFVESGKFAGVIDENGRIITASDMSDEDISECVTEDVDGNVIPQQTSSAPSTHLGIAPKADEQRFVFALTRGLRAHLIVPVDVNANDVKIIQKQIELLALQVELAEPTGSN